MHVSAAARSHLYAGARAGAKLARRVAHHNRALNGEPPPPAAGSDRVGFTRRPDLMQFSTDVISSTFCYH